MLGALPYTLQKNGSIFSRTACQQALWRHDQDISALPRFSLINIFGIFSDGANEGHPYPAITFARQARLCRVRKVS
jgi:hypothetical protein